MITFRKVSVLFVAFSLSLLVDGCKSFEKGEASETNPIIDGELEHDSIGQTETEFLEDLIKNGFAGRDMTEIRESGVLKAVTLYSSTGYFLYRGQTMGFEFELLENLTNQLGLELQIVVAKGIQDMLHILYSGEADLIAYGLTITENRRKYMDFTDYLYLSHQVLVQRKPENWRDMKFHEIEDELISDNVELIGKTVSVRANTAYLSRLDNLMEELGDVIFIDTMPKNYKTERLIQMVVDGQIKYTVADNNIATVNASYYPELDVKVPMSFSQRIGWVVRKNSPDLLKALNSWLTAIKRKPNFNVIYDRYFSSEKDFRKRLRDDYYSMESGMISQYDGLIKKHAEKTNLDWRLLSALIYQESQFNPQAKSWAGAQGLMQLMPATAKELGVNNRADPDENLRGGIQYLKEMWDNWEDIPDITQRLKFAMASFNCGYYHVRDAVRLAEKNNDEYLVWDNHVENYILKLSDPEYFNDDVVHYGYVRGIEPYTYVLEIFERYDHYCKFVAE